jgi:hypothetical protein
MATRMLLNHGHQRIGYLSSNHGIEDDELRREGWSKAPKPGTMRFISTMPGICCIKSPSSASLNAFECTISAEQRWRITTQVSDTIGVVVMDVSDAFFGALVKAVDTVAQQHGYPGSPARCCSEPVKPSPRKPPPDGRHHEW